MTSTMTKELAGFIYGWAQIMRERRCNWTLLRTGAPPRALDGIGDCEDRTQNEGWRRWCCMRDGVDDDVASRPGRLHMGRPIIQETVQGGLIGRRGRPYKVPDLPYPPIQGSWEARLPEKTWEECTLLPKKHHTAHCSEKIVTLKSITLHTTHFQKSTQICLLSQLFYAE